MADQGSVNTLYHEATHAYIDLVDLDDENLWAEAVWIYKRAKLKSGKMVSHPSRVVNEAAAMYVGHRASSMYHVWTQMATSWNSVLDLVDAKKLTRAQMDLVIARYVPEGTIEAAYNTAMREVVFGYDAEGLGPQDEVIGQPIPQQLRTYCDAVILEDKIKNDFRSMKVYRSCSPTIAFFRIGWRRAATSLVSNGEVGTAGTSARGSASRSRGDRRRWASRRGSSPGAPASTAPTSRTSGGHAQRQIG